MDSTPRPCSIWKAAIAPLNWPKTATNSAPALPGSIQKVFKNFQPSGTIQAAVEVQRRDSGGKITYSGTCLVSHGKGRFYKFPYSLRDIHGPVLFDDEGVRVVDLTCSGPNGGKIVLNGTVAPPGDGAAVEMTAVATDFPADQNLYDALEPKYQHVLDMFMDQKQYQRLIEKGIIQSSAQSMERWEQLSLLEADHSRLESARGAVRSLESLEAKIASLQLELQRPVFDLGGRVKVSVEIHRAPGPQGVGYGRPRRSSARRRSWRLAPLALPDQSDQRPDHRESRSRERRGGGGSRPDRRGRSL